MTILQTPVPPTPPVPPPPPSLPFDPNVIWMSDGGPPAVVMIALLGLLATTVILWPVMRALARRLEGRSAPDPGVREELEQLQHRLGEVDALQMRVAELEERLDFAERLLTRGQEVPAATVRNEPS